MNSLRFPNLYDAMAQQIAASMQQQLAGIDQRQLAGQQLGLQHQQAAALASQPSAEREFYGAMPPKLPEWLEPGATWTANRGSPNEYTFRLLSRAHNDGGWAAGCERWVVSGAYERIAPDHEHFDRPCGDIELDEVNWQTVRRLSAPSADKWEPAVGDAVTGIGVGYHAHDEEHRLTGRLVSLDCWAMYRAALAAQIEGDCGQRWFVHTDSLRPATPSPKAECQHRNVNLHTMRCDDCGMSDKDVRARVADPYRKVEEAAPRWMTEQNAKHAALIAKHREDLDRGKAERLRNTRNWPEAWSTAGWDSDG